MILDNAVGWTLLHTIWEGAIIALILSIALWFLRSSSLRYAAACIALATTLAGFVFTLIHLIPGSQGVVMAGGSLHSVPPGIDPAQLAPLPPAPSVVILPQWIAPLWLVGVVLFQLRALGGWVAVWRLRRTGVCVASDHWQIRVRELAAGLGITKTVVLLQSGLAGVPLAIGHLRPVILMPLGLLTGLPCAQVETILMHELAHIRRSDYLVNLVQTLAEGLMFYHPAVWWISSVIRTERENCCDDLVVATSGDAHEYAVALATLAEGRWPAQDVALAATGGSLVKRIRRLLRRAEGPRASRMASLIPPVAAVLLFVTFGVALVAYQSSATAAPAASLSVPAAAPTKMRATKIPATKPVMQLAQAQPQQAATPTTAIPAPWMKWLTEDVAYIITDAESAAFRKLTTEQEREHFVEQFWLSRDPTPGTPQNEYKEEHYRRIAYANEHYYFERSGVPGWKTDRGRIYIQYGPPDEIDSHPSGGSYQRPEREGGGMTSTYPFEDWRYRYIRGIGNDVNIEFVDKAMNGEYHMTMDPSEKDALLVK